ncbi:hypothetical protein ASPZODRAFT_119957 [Penicilliopsis zonata CBS 506.65]|uniref:Elongation factor 1 alpha-like protein n=1 Tax=Penicilliopsis zonata CBS 506.65 TaxID=1073090 RepID=A0A1L9SEA4_9EURO|nr:hypothetical protein ASPZODRAFT_119957 [Penicilliopsis zonata CBS 506.65]OJJ45509.1 hypothetical protein ASPZODRAFT_119957 [Penicilliopsis zonata CBS 506.65]
MSRHRMKTVSYDDDDDYDDYEEDDGYASPDPEEQARLEQCIQDVLSQLRGGEPSVSASREEVTEALWHYYNDVTKSVNYIRGKKAKEVQKQPPKKGTVSSYPLPPSWSSACAVPFSAAEFFRDSPWLNVPEHRKADIIVEPLHPRLGLLGGAPEAGGKVSKLAALAAARKKKESEKVAASPSPVPTPKAEEQKPEEVGDNNNPASAPSRSLLERLSSSHNGRQLKPAEGGLGGLRALGKGSRMGGATAPTKKSSLEKEAEIRAQTKPGSVTQPAKGEEKETAVPQQQDEQQAPVVNMMASPSTFATIIVGDATRPVAAAQSSHLKVQSVDVMDIYGQDLTEAFDFAGPSPDDLVLNAQSSAKGFKSKQPASKSKKVDLTGGMNNLSVEEKVSIKSKNLDVLSEYKKVERKKAASFVVIGHVDAGKSTLMGRLLADLQAVDARTLEKYRREAEKIGKGSFALAWVLDQGSEERARGVTIDIATNKFETDKTAFTIVDAPGHRDFVPNMIAGASQADFAVLVIDASTGNFESGLKGQTKEHALLVRSMGVQKIVVAVNKMDTVEWDRERFEEIEQQISSFLTAAGFQPKNISFIPLSGFHGDNVTRRSEAPQAAWYQGRTLIEELDTSEPFSHALEKPLRMTIADVFRGGVQSPLSISGRIDAGSLQVGDQILIMPSGEKASIRSLEVDSAPADWAVAGQNIVLNLANIDPIHLRSGDVVCSPASPIQNLTSFTTKVLAFEHLMPMLVDIHRGRLHVPGRISRVVATLDKGSGAPVKKRPKIVAPGAVARIVVEMDQAVPLEAPARIVLRAGGNTVAAGLLES